jgi:hypothetical protein
MSVSQLLEDLLGGDLVNLRVAGNDGLLVAELDDGVAATFSGFDRFACFFVELLDLLE